METIKIKKEIELPLVVGETYFTKFQTKEKFKITKLIYDRFNVMVVSVNGIYEKTPHLGECPLPVERIVHKINIIEEEIEICPNCKKPL